MIMLFMDVTIFTSMMSCNQALRQLDPEVTLALKCICLSQVKNQKSPKQVLILCPLKKKNKNQQTNPHWLVLNLTFLIHKNGWKCCNMSIWLTCRPDTTKTSVFFFYLDPRQTTALLFQSDQKYSFISQVTVSCSQNTGINKKLHILVTVSISFAA